MPHKKKDCILVVELAGQPRLDMEAGLSENGFDVVVAASYDEVTTALQGGGIDVTVLDPNIVRDDGMQLIRELTAAFPTPLIIISDKVRTIHKIVGLEMGADDYMCRPIEVDELAARIRAVLRRSRPSATVQSTSGKSAVGLASPIYRFDGWHFDAGRRELTDPNGEPVDLTSMEAEMLITFVRNAQTPLSRLSIIEHLGKRGDPTSVRTIDVLISKLRKKIERDGNDMIKTVRGAGYVFTPLVTR